MENLNENELKVLKVIMGSDEYGERPTCVAEDLYYIGLTINQVKGYISDLEKKGFIIDCELPNGMTAWQYLNEDERI